MHLPLLWVQPGVARARAGIRLADLGLQVANPHAHVLAEAARGPLPPAAAPAVPGLLRGHQNGFC